MLPGLAPASCAISRIETALKPLVENSTSAALRMASRIFEFRVIGFDSVFSFVRMYKGTGPVNKETQDDVARRSNPSGFSRSRRISSSAGSRRCTDQYRLGRHTP